MSSFYSDGLKNYLRGKWLLWDTSALIRLVDCDAEVVFQDLEDSGVTESVTIKPVILELGATKDRILAIKRKAYVDNNISSILKLNIDTPKDKTEIIRDSLPKDCRPGPVDLMLGSTLAEYGRDERMVLITENIKDFPEPLFTKKGFIMVSNAGRSFGLTILAIDLTVLDQ